ncbi:THO complex subunit 5A [Elaeis guineensis]|uniref:THO complex subunit 5A n=1 Tax=Elaeis guineensis var. tenera TaxID=51953 RepID=UPI003C6D7A38
MQAMEVEAIPNSKRSPHDVLEETRTAMEEIAAKMLFIKKDGRPKSDLRELITQMSLLLLSLRQVNRSILMEEDRVKVETESAKAPVDFTTLQLHNLMYEKNHYLKAIKACKDFRSKYPDIDLVSEEEFFRSAPEDIKGKVLASDAAHDLMLKRLNFELYQRKELYKLHEKLEQHKKSLLDTIANRKKFLSSLPSHLKSLKKATLPVQQQLGILHTKKLKQHHAAELLPPPLYIVYSQLLAQKEAFGERIEMEILGSVKDAQIFAQQQANKDSGLSSNTENNRLEEDAPDEEEDVQRRRKRPKRNQVKENIDQAGVCQIHPLKIILHIYDDEESEAKPSKLITLRFEYLVKLNVACVGVEDSEEGSDNNILCNLFPDDTGIELPHQAAKLYAGDSLAFGERRASRPYKWAQHLAGIDFLPEVPPLHECNEALSSEALKGLDVAAGLSIYRHQNRVQTILQRIRSRKKAQMALVEQLDSLMKLRWPLLAYGDIPWALHDPLCTLQNCSSSELIPDSSSFSAVVVGQVAHVIDLDLDRRSVTSWEVESAREDGELPTALPAANSPDDSKVTMANGSSEHVEHSRSLALITKSVTPSKKVKSRVLRKSEDDLELILDSDSELEEHTCIDQEIENVRVGKPWEDHAAKEFTLILTRTYENERNAKLNAKVKISTEYPLRPPLFTLSLLSDGPQGFEWYNELRAMEAEVNLHIIKVLPLEHENYILAHQIRCLAMLFDFHFDARHEKRKSTSIIDVGLCKPVSGTILARSVRGRDRRKMISWKGMGCTPGYPC